MEFHCRENELLKMNKKYEDDNFECIIIYGRRRVGKTSLINKFCEDKRFIKFPALNSTDKENLRALSREIYSFTNPEAESFPEYASFDDAFREITRLSKEERLVFVIDEYPYLAKADNSISSKLQHLIDNVWQDTKIYLILCGSSMSFMLNQVLGYESPLYGRRTAQFKIEPLTYKETAQFKENLSAEDKAILFGITGGIPHYINKLQVKKKIDVALVNNMFDSSAYLFEEPENLLKQELREPAVYNSIISAIATGSSKLNEIATKCGIETGAVSKYLSVLMEIGIVRRETPITEKIGKKSIYLIEDDFFRFWYRYVPRNLSLIMSGRLEDNFERAVKNSIHDYMGLVFEKMCKQYLLYYANDLPFDLAEIGQWWGTDSKTRKEIQIDIVGIPIADNNSKVTKYLVGSCKFKNEKIGLSELELLQQYACVFGKGIEYYYTLFSLSGFTDELISISNANNNVKLITLNEMY